MDKDFKPMWLSTAELYQTTKELLEMNMADGLDPEWCEREIAYCERKIKFCLMRGQGEVNVIDRPDLVAMYLTQKH